MADNELEIIIARVTDILEQIRDLNKLIDFQKEQEADTSTLDQYEFIRQEFVNELSSILKEFKLDLSSLDIAA